MMVTEKKYRLADHKTVERGTIEIISGDNLEVSDLYSLFNWRLLILSLAAY